MSNPFLPPPPTNETLVVAEFTRHLEEERRERRRRLPGVVAHGALIAVALALLLTASSRIGVHTIAFIGDCVTEWRAARPHS